MIAKIKKLLLRYREQLSYLFFGVLTTLVNLAVFWFLDRRLDGRFALEISTAVAWLVAVLFAYWTNRTWVFESKVSGRRAIFKEAAAFFGARVLSGVIDYLFLAISVKVFHLPAVPMKFISNIIVVLLNYVFSKLFVFRKKEENRSSAE